MNLWFGFLIVFDQVLYFLTRYRRECDALHRCRFRMRHQQTINPHMFDASTAHVAYLGRGHERVGDDDFYMIGCQKSCASKPDMGNFATLAVFRRSR